MPLEKLLFETVEAFDSEEASQFPEAKLRDHGIVK
ncbi:hypothetical protein J2S37_000591 [Corynebacterium felinum]|uniref:Uncharacterized protein n=1 Tax=Corynebacterium felinum TaxID=131318 RepID=A0ABU2B614_9CORY|nr:hypothetical protein [Corynebacterium felinum]